MSDIEFPAANPNAKVCNLFENNCKFDTNLSTLIPNDRIIKDNVIDSLFIELDC